MQRTVADKLNAEWRNKEVRVIQVIDYYKNNGQLDYLLSHGFSTKQIGRHAGIRDSSELLAVKPEGIRDNLLIDNSNSVYTEVGADGDASKASIYLGQQLLELKINAAVLQIHRVISNKK
ncbi:MAG: hypothetical protein KAJ63_05210, partial [Methyloprofundus sp.]|nr:hypothetical protein [Methyloprofundus sp.]